MTRCIIFICCCLLAFSSKAQQSDFLVLKKGQKVIRRIYAGQQLEFITTGGAYRDALINRIANDSLYLQEFLVRRLPTTFGTYILDTAGSFRYTYHYNQVQSFGRPQKGFNVQGSGAALLGGGVVLTLASGVVYLADREKFSPALMAASAGLAVAGYFMSKSGSKGIVIGKKRYHLQYINLTNNISK
jgi:hypothetical protein